MNYKKFFATIALAISAFTFVFAMMPAQAQAAVSPAKARMVADTFQYTGTPYRWGGNTPAGFDCSGFIWYMYRTHGLWMPRTTAADMYYNKGTWVRAGNLQPGDLVFFSHNRPGVPAHVGIYVGHNKFISATNSKGIWTYTMFGNSYWGPRYIGAKRI